ncbi:phosphoribosylformylglycinamidine synthase subunit PurQ, partial [Thiolapillus sp.]|uniref:phosphoribosylformylglycinamidine synthase subunit PurQ n=1 Tax=Thiolapillus sp. TaxID=2017437 RepID=UPI003AF604C1
LFSEELGLVLQVRHSDCDDVVKCLEDAGLGHHSHVLGSTRDDEIIVIRQGNEKLLERRRSDLQQIWSEITLEMQALRDNPACAREEHERIAADDPGLNASLSFDPEEDIAAAFPEVSRPRVAILREQGVNGQQEMAYAFHKADFEAVDVHMSDILSGAVSLADFKGMVACGGFSYGDVLGAGEGWAKSILFHSRSREQFQAFFERDDTFSLGVCNGCQMLSNIKELIPGAAHWPHFVRNRSEQFEARVSMVEVLESPSILLQGMQGSRMPIAVAHGEGRAEYWDAMLPGRGISLRFVDNHGAVAVKYPENPNGSPEGITGLTSDDGRATIMMPHPERVIRTVQNSWHPDDWGEDSPWMRLFRNARVWVG